MAGRRDEVQENVDAVVPEARVTLDAGLLSENVIVLSLEISNDLSEAARALVLCWYPVRAPPYLASLSIWSPNPGVSTMVSEMRVPSSSSSSSDDIESANCPLCTSSRGHHQAQGHLPTVTGWIFTPSSRCATVGSSDSLCERTCLLQSVFTNVVRPVVERSEERRVGKECPV